MRSSDRSAPSIALEPRPATGLRIAHAVLLALALGALASARLPISLINVVSIAALVSGWRADRVLQRMARVRLVLQPDGSWLAHDGHRDRIVHLCEHAVLGPLVALGFAAGGRTAHRLVLLPGAVAPGTERSLRAWLRHGYHARPERRAEP